MNKDIKECFILLKRYRKNLSRQQVTTFKGQILSGNIDGFRTGLFNVIKRKLVN